jgi:hypothetical protein
MTDTSHFMQKPTAPRPAGIVSMRQRIAEFRARLEQLLLFRRASHRSPYLLRNFLRGLEGSPGAKSVQFEGI